MIVISRYLINTFTVLALSTYFTYVVIQLSKLCRLYKNKTRPENCPICYQTLDTDKNYCITPCGHRFCLTCMIKNQKYSSLCPICRYNLNKEDTTNSTRIPFTEVNAIINLLYQINQFTHNLNQNHPHPGL